VVKVPKGRDRDALKASRWQGKKWTGYSFPSQLEGLAVSGELQADLAEMCALLAPGPSNPL